MFGILLDSFKGRHSCYFTFHNLYILFQTLEINLKALGRPAGQPGLQALAKAARQPGLQALASLWPGLQVARAGPAGPVEPELALHNLICLFGTPMYGATCIQNQLISQN